MPRLKLPYYGYIRRRISTFENYSAEKSGKEEDGSEQGYSGNAYNVRRLGGDKWNPDHLG